MKKCRKIYASLWLSLLLIVSVCVCLAVNADSKAILAIISLKACHPLSLPVCVCVCVCGRHIELTANETAANGEGVGLLLCPFFGYGCQAMCRVLASKIPWPDIPGKLPKCQEPVTTIRVACRMWVHVSRITQIRSKIHAIRLKSISSSF